MPTKGEKRKRRLNKRFAKEKAVIEVALRVGGPAMALEVRTKFNKLHSKRRLKKLK